MLFHSEIIDKISGLSLQIEIASEKFDERCFSWMKVNLPDLLSPITMIVLLIELESEKFYWLGFYHMLEFLISIGERIIVNLSFSKGSLIDNLFKFL